MAFEKRAAQLRAQLTRRARDVIIALEGELDIGSVDTLSKALERAGDEASERIVVDLSRVEFMDSTGLRILIGAHRRARETDRSLVVVTGDSPAARVLELTRMGRHLSVVRVLDDAG